MKDLITALPSASGAEYLLDTCFLIHAVESGRVKQLSEFCSSHKVAMSSFNLEELVHVAHRLKGTEDHHIREFLKSGKISRIDVPVHPGEREAEKAFVKSFDERILHLVPDPSDAVLFVLALKIGATILSRDRHHIFTALAENFSAHTSTKILNNFP
jgi:predicted nucleic acid-binding protein